MNKTQERTEKILLVYPPLKGCILKAHHLHGQLAASFDAVVELEERAGERLSLLLNGETIYSQTVDEQFDVDFNSLFSALCDHSVPVEKQPLESKAEELTASDPDHLQWMNSVCSGE